MYEVLTREQPYHDVELSAKDIVDLVGHRQIPLVSKHNKHIDVSRLPHHTSRFVQYNITLMIYLCSTSADQRGPMTRVM